MRSANEIAKEAESSAKSSKAQMSDAENRASALATELATARATVSGLNLKLKQSEANLEASRAQHKAAEYVQCIRTAPIAAHRVTIVTDRVCLSSPLSPVLPVALLRAELRRQNTRADKANANATAADAAARRSDEEYKLLDTKSRTELAALQARLKVLSEAHGSVEDTLRTQFGRELEALLSERLSEFEEEKTSALNELRNVYEAKLVAYREQLEAVGADVDSERSKNEQLRLDCMKQKAAAAEAIANREALVTCALSVSGCAERDSLSHRSCGVGAVLAVCSAALCCAHCVVCRCVVRMS
jgi:hypothetical protein